MVLLEVEYERTGNTKTERAREKYGPQNHCAQFATRCGVQSARGDDPGCCIDGQDGALGDHGLYNRMRALLRIEDGTEYVADNVALQQTAGPRVGSCCHYAAPCCTGFAETLSTKS